MKKLISMSLLTMGILVLGGCGSSNSASTTPTGNVGGVAPIKNQTAPNPATVNQGQGMATESNAIGIQNFAFSPATLTVKKGATVTWTNNDSATHTIKSNTFNSGNIAKGETFKFTFDTVGTFDYSCGIHPSMMGKIIVQ